MVNIVEHGGDGAPPHVSVTLPFKWHGVREYVSCESCANAAQGLVADDIRHFLEVVQQWGRFPNGLEWRIIVQPNAVQVYFSGAKRVVATPAVIDTVRALRERIETQMPGRDQIRCLLHSEAKRPNSDDIVWLAKSLRIPAVVELLRNIAIEPLFRELHASLVFFGYCDVCAQRACRWARTLLSPGQVGATAVQRADVEDAPIGVSLCQVGDNDTELPLARPPFWVRNGSIAVESTGESVIIDPAFHEALLNSAAPSQKPKGMHITCGTNVAEALTSAFGATIALLLKGWWIRHKAPQIGHALYGARVLREVEEGFRGLLREFGGDNSNVERPMNERAPLEQQRRLQQQQQRRQQQVMTEQMHDDRQQLQRQMQFQEQLEQQQQMQQQQQMGGGNISGGNILYNTAANGNNQESDFAGGGMKNDSNDANSNGVDTIISQVKSDADALDAISESRRKDVVRSHNNGECTPCKHHFTYKCHFGERCRRCHDDSHSTEFTRKSGSSGANKTPANLIVPPTVAFEDDPLMQYLSSFASIPMPKSKEKPKPPTTTSLDSFPVLSSASATEVPSVSRSSAAAPTSSPAMSAAAALSTSSASSASSVSSVSTNSWSAAAAKAPPKENPPPVKPVVKPAAAVATNRNDGNTAKAAPLHAAGTCTPCAHYFLSKCLYGSNCRMCHSSDHQKDGTVANLREQWRGEIKRRDDLRARGLWDEKNNCMVGTAETSNDAAPGSGGKERGSGKKKKTKATRDDGFVTVGGGDNAAAAKKPKAQENVVHAEEVHGEFGGLLCSICLEREVSICLQPCGHSTFCWECISEWYDRHDDGEVTCPICRDPIEEAIPLNL